MNEENRQVSSSFGLTQSYVDILVFSFALFYKPELGLASKYFLNLMSFNVVLEGEFIKIDLSQTMPSILTTSCSYHTAAMKQIQ